MTRTPEIMGLIAQFRNAAIDKAGFGIPTTRDHQLHARMASAVHGIFALGPAGATAFEELLDDQSPNIRIWAAAELLARGNSAARDVLEALCEEPGPVGFSADMTLQEFDAGRFRSPFSA